MATVKKSKKKVIVPICVVLVIAIVAASIFGVVKSNSVTEVKLHTISTDDIYETVSLTGEVSAGATQEYKVSTVATVKEVFVNVGDTVKKDDLLATFDVTELDSQISSLEASYNTALKDYNAAVENQKTAKTKAAELKEEIADLEKQISKLEQNTTTILSTTKATTTNATKTATGSSSADKKDLDISISDVSINITTSSRANTTTTKASTTGSSDTTTSFTVPDVSIPDVSIPDVSLSTSTTNEDDETSSRRQITIPSTTTTKSDDSTSTTKKKVTVTKSDSSLTNITVPTTSSLATSITTSLEGLNSTLTQITDDIDTLATMTEIISATIAEKISSGEFDSDVIAEAVADALTQAVKDGMIDSAHFLVESGLAIEMVETAVSSIDFQGMTDAAVNSNNVSLTAAEIQLASKEAQYEIYEAQTNDTLLDAQKSAVDASKKALDTLQEQKDEMEQGWKAAFDGTITAVDIAPNTQTTLLSSGITLENLDKMVVSVSLSEYDLHKVKTGMSAVVTTAYGTYDGEVASIAPTATGGSESSILDNVGSMAGISGLSSLTSSGAGVDCQITIDETDENIIAGFDANVEIETGEYLGVVVVPIESIKLEKTGSYVYLYDEEEGTVTKTQIETGAISDSYYEVTSGLKVGDRIISAPESSYDEDTFEVKVSTK